MPFWRDAEGKGYFDGCIRDEKQARLAYRYTLLQAVRHGIVTRLADYPHTQSMWSSKRRFGVRMSSRRFWKACLTSGIRNRDEASSAQSLAAR